MVIKPVLENEAPPALKPIYQQLRESLDTPTVPLFFCYLGAFPEYFEYIGPSLIENIKDPHLQKILFEPNRFVKETFSDKFVKTAETTNFLWQNRETKEFTYYQKELENILVVNSKITLLFLAIREAVKGWAVAAKKLPTDSKKSYQEKTDFLGREEVEELVFADYPRLKTTALAQRPGQAITKSWFAAYLVLCQKDFQELLKQENFLFFRVGIEKILLRSLDSLNQPINSPINVVLTLTKKYPHFVEFLYLLSERLPTLAVQKLLFSGYCLF